MSTFINIGTYNDNHQDNHRELSVNVPPGTDISNLVQSFFSNPSQHTQPEDIEPVDTSFFGVDRFPEDVCEKNLREAISGASSKADACRRIMIADTCGYIHLRRYTDARKAELVNPFAKPLYTFNEEDFKKARNRQNKA